MFAFFIYWQTFQRYLHKAFSVWFEFDQCYQSFFGCIFLVLGPFWYLFQRTFRTHYLTVLRSNKKCLRIKFVLGFLFEHISPCVCMFSHFEFHQLKERPEGGFWIIWWFSSAGLPADGHGQIHWIQQGLCLTGRHYQFHLQPGHLGF